MTFCGRAHDTGPGLRLSGYESGIASRWLHLGNTFLFQNLATKITTRLGPTGIFKAFVYSILLPDSEKLVSPDWNGWRSGVEARFYSCTSILGDIFLWVGFT